VASVWWAMIFPLVRGQQFSVTRNLVRGGQKQMTGFWPAFRDFATPAINKQRRKNIFLQEVATGEIFFTFIAFRNSPRGTVKIALSREKLHHAK
jgi:hypothetical protein